MKIHRVLCLGAVLALPALALGDLQLPRDAFGRFEGSLDVCIQVDSQNAPKYQEKKKILVEGASQEEVAEARASKEYKQAYDSAKQEMSKQPKDEIVKACSESLDPKK